MNKEQVLIYNFDKLAEQFKKKEFERVAKENQEYKEVIDKAINYINEHSEFMFRKAERRIFDGKLEYVDGVKVFTGSLTELLDILKEVR